ncbi:cofilin family protein [Streptomyces goshikiensis]|uniref:cofilin family protein n=1 Tax=Streptomyces goshikiensis TaxID=1942 RepID=UPI0036669063
MNQPTPLSEESLDALQHLKETREINTVILCYPHHPGALELDLEGNLTHDEMVQALPDDEPRLIVHELSFASPEGTRRSERLLILWVPAAATAHEEAYTAGYESLKEMLPGVRVHLTARRADQLEYRRLVALAG